MNRVNQRSIRKRLTKENETAPAEDEEDGRLSQSLVSQSGDSLTGFKVNLAKLSLFGAKENELKKMTNLNEKLPLIECRVDKEPFINSDSLYHPVHDEAQENMLTISIQIFIPFLIAGFGTVGAGLVLDFVQHWDVFRNITELIILVPALLGLKGNLEMTLASRLSTQANLGRLNSSIDKWKIAIGNVALIQCQATVVGILAALFAIIMGWLPDGKFILNHALLSCASSVLTASLASFVLGLVMISVVIISHECHINPDNVATPIAASLGDLTTIFILAHISNLFYYSLGESNWLCVFVIIVTLILIPFWCVIASRNEYTHEVLYTGWTPVISAMAISSLGGCILDFAIARFKGIALFQPVINGVGGNLVAVQASRMSTYLHQTSKLGIFPFQKLPSAFFSKNIHAKTARCLLLMTIPGHLIFTLVVRLLQGYGFYTPTFLIVYLFAAFVQVFLLLYLAHLMIFWMWSRKIDPDNSAIPYLTAIGDLLGTSLLTLAFLFLSFIRNSDLAQVK